MSSRYDWMRRWLQGRVRLLRFDQQSRVYYNWFNFKKDLSIDYCTIVFKTVIDCRTMKYITAEEFLLTQTHFCVVFTTDQTTQNFHCLDLIAWLFTLAICGLSITNVHISISVAYRHILGLTYIIHFCYVLRENFMVSLNGFVYLSVVIFVSTMASVPMAFVKNIFKSFVLYHETIYYCYW